jgi:hypothetical protein
MKNSPSFFHHTLSAKNRPTQWFHINQLPKETTYPIGSQCGNLCQRCNTGPVDGDGQRTKSVKIPR